MVNVIHIFFIIRSSTVGTFFVCSIFFLLEIPGPSGSGNPLVVVGPGGDILGPTDERESIATTQSCNEHQVEI